MERIGLRVIPVTPGGCWLWTGAVTRQGYGRMDETYVHRVVYEHVNGSIPPGHHLHHECRVRRCFNPEHLTPMSASQHRLHHAGARR
ncbi:HNH endonuclease signature motif containing protein [Miltoncostaea oceani]|uniref:HNH endonuclease signature motif containing protein n=1 Tax=Miltoncostaea oceani TaxID=2843216 RepID=UPI001C3E8656|nr:HNH endonuclease signature motif containing protein [Miltoncostaea oceani]